MADLFLSYARPDRARAAAVAAAIEQDGRSLWWDERLASGEDYATVIEREIAAATHVVVAWSASARDSLWVRAEANEALDRGKLVQINFDGAKPPLPFTILHWIDFSGWSGGREQAPWPQLSRAVEPASDTQAEAAPRGWRPDPGGVPVAARTEPALQGLERVAALGWAALGTAILLCFAVMLVARRLISAEAFGMFAVAAAIVSAGLLAACAYTMLRTARGSRR
jgi:hypothetical protein